MNIDFIFRLIGAVVFCVLGINLGANLGAFANANDAAMTMEQYAFTFGLGGILLGLIVTPYVTTIPIRSLTKALTRMAAQKLFAALLGLVSGLITAALLSIPLALLPEPFNSLLPFVAVVFFVYLGITVFTTRENDMINMLKSITGGGTTMRSSMDAQLVDRRKILLDTSVIIDGRIADIAKAGFLPGKLVVPRFVLTELQYIADSADALRRQRGRRGMEVLAQMQKEPKIPVQITDMDVDGTNEVDDKLVILARQMHCPVLTNDYNLNRVAELQGVMILNVNELANAVKSVMLPGEFINLKVIQEGKEINQGVGYLDDGTMVVIENGKNFLDRTINVEVTKVLQTAAGRMVFAKPDRDT